MNKNQPIFQPIFDDKWDSLPPALKKHYANRGYSDDVVKLDGVMHIKMSKLTRLMKPLFRLLGALVPYEGENISTTVYSKSEPDSNNYILERHFNFEDKKPYVFRSSLNPIEGDEVVEIMKFGVGWRCKFDFVDGKVLLLHRGFVVRMFGKLLPLPLALLMGKGYAEEEATGEDSFKMLMTITHPWFGTTFDYRGEFKIA